MISLLAAALPECATVAVPVATETAIRHYDIGNLLWTLELILSFAIPLVILMTGFSAKIERFAYRLGKYWFFSISIYLVLFIAIYQIVSLPLDYYSSYVFEHAYGLPTQSLSKWAANYGKSALLYMIGSILFVWIFYLLLLKSPKRWWLYSSLVAISITFFITFITPIWIDPLFDKIGPMKNKELEQKLLALAARAGIQNDRVYEVEKSGDTKMINAYVTGIWGSERIVIWDTSANSKDIDGLMFIMGHEMGHYVLNHNWWFLLYFSISTFVIFYLIYKAGNYLIRLYHNDFGFNHLYHIASLPLFLFLINLFSFLVSPLFNYISRDMERAADRFGLELTHNNYAAANLFAEMAEDNLANPNPGKIYLFFRATHPSLKERIEFCNSYCPWER